MTVRPLYRTVREAIGIFIDTGMMTQGAALAYYTFFAAAPLVIVALAIAGFCFGPEAASKQLFNQINGMVGDQGGQAIQAIVAAASRPKSGLTASIITGVVFVFGAAGVFVQLQNSLNLIWRVRTRKGHGLHGFIRHRFLSFAMVLGVGFLLLVSLILSAGLAAIGGFIGAFLSDRLIIAQILNGILSLVINTALFAFIFKFLPDVKISWWSVWQGGLITAILFNIGKLCLGLYIGHSAIASIYGTMGSLVILLVWVYYSAQIVFFGAALTSVIAAQSPAKPLPIAGAEFLPEATSTRAHQPT